MYVERGHPVGVEREQGRRIRYDDGGESGEFQARVDRVGRHECRLLGTVDDYESKTQHVVYAGNGTTLSL